MKTETHQFLRSRLPFHAFAVKTPTKPKRRLNPNRNQAGAYQLCRRGSERMAAKRPSKFLSPAEMEKMFKEVFGPRLESLGFKSIGKSRWVRETGLGFKHLFYFHPFRAGADYYPYGAISFDFAPRIERGKVRLRPEPKYARPHLVIADDFRHGATLGIHRQ